MLNDFKLCVIFFVFFLLFLNSTCSYAEEIQDKTSAHEDLCDDIWMMYIMSSKTKTKTENDITDTCIQLLSATEEKKYPPTFEGKGKLLDNILETLKKSTTIEAISITTPISEHNLTTNLKTFSAVFEATTTSIKPNNETNITENKSTTKFGISETTPQPKLETTSNNYEITLFDNNITTDLPEIRTLTTQYENTVTLPSDNNVSSQTPEIDTNTSNINDEITMDPRTKDETEIGSIPTIKMSDSEIKTTSDIYSTESNILTATTILKNETTATNVEFDIIPNSTPKAEERIELALNNDNGVSDDNGLSTIADNMLNSTNNNIMTTSMTENPTTDKNSVILNENTMPITKYDATTTSTEQNVSNNNATNKTSEDITTADPFESNFNTTVNHIIEETGNFTKVTEILTPKPTETENLPANQAGFDWKILQWSLIALAAILALFGFIVLYRCLKKRSESTTRPQPE